MASFEDFELLQFDQDLDQQDSLSLWEFIEISDAVSDDTHHSDSEPIGPTLTSPETRAHGRRLVRLVDLPFQTPLNLDLNLGRDDEDEEKDEEDDEVYGLDDELVPWSVSDKLGRERMRKLGKRTFAKMQSSKRSPYLVVRPGCLRGKHGLGLKHIY